MKLIFFKRLLLGIAVGAVVSLSLLLIFSLILSKQSDPTQNAELFSYLALCLGAFAAGKAATVGLDGRLPLGLATAAVILLVMLALSIAFKGSGSLSYLKMLLTAVSAVAGAIVGKKGARSVSSGRRRKEVIRRYAR